MLALDRCMEMWDSQIAAKFFGGFRVNLWVIAALVYGMGMGFLTIPPLPNGILVGWFWNPHIPYVADPEGYVSLLRLGYRQPTLQITVPSPTFCHAQFHHRHWNSLHVLHILPDDAP